MTALRGMLADSEDLRALIANPGFSRDDKQNALTALAGKAKFSALTTRFLGVVSGNGRARGLPEIITAFQDKVDAHRGVTVAEVAAPQELTDAQKSDIAAALKKVVGKDVEVRATVQPELLGGLIVKVGSRMFDSSLRTKLDGIKSVMKGA